MITPDYQGGSIVNLMSSIIRARGGGPDYPPLRLLPPEDIVDTTNVVLLVVDGLGADWLGRRLPDGLLHRHLLGPITSVFPPTTASAITSFLTGDAPQQHALTGWYTYLRELGCVLTVLPGNPRYGGVGYRKAGVDPARLFGHRPISERITTRSVFVSPAYIAHSDFNLAHLGRAELHTFDKLGEMFRRTARAIRRSRELKYLYLYWPRLDAIGHEEGMESAAALSHLLEIEQALNVFLQNIAGTDTLVLVTADHGQIDTTPEECIDLADHPDLAQCLALPLCGEPRAAFCYVRPRLVDVFEGYCRQVLGDALDLWPSQTLVDRGLFGLGKPHPRLAERVGDYVILMRGNRVIRDWLPFEKTFQHVGVHGGLTLTELEVPLCVLRA
jgi:hypothetical protein